MMDTFGIRKTACIFGALSVAASLICVFSREFYIFFSALFFLGFGTAAGIAAVRALVPEDFSGKTYSVVITSIVLLYSLAPGLGQALGGLIADTFPWWSIFLFITCLSITSFFILFYYHYEITPPKGHALESFKQTWTFLSNMDFLRYNVAAMAVYSAIYGYSVMSTYLFRNHYHWSLKELSAVGLMIGLGCALGALIARQASLRDFPMGKLFYPGFVLMAVPAVLLVGLSLLFQDLPGYWVLFLSFFYFVGGGLVNSATTAEALLVNTRYSGVASSLIGILSSLAVSLSILIIAHIHDSLLNLSLFLACLALMGAAFVFLRINARTY